jgi:hypothetical protein
MIINFIDPGQMTPALEGSCQPYFHYPKGFLLRDGSLAKGEAIAVVMGTTPDCHLLIPAKSAADTLYAVRDDGLAVAGATQHNTSFDVTSGDHLCDWSDEIRIITGGVGVCTAIPHGVAFSKKHGLDLLLIGIASMVGANCDREFFHET